MPAPSRQNTKPPLPRNHLIFDPWNTGSVGHECAHYSHARQTAAHRDMRTIQLGRQFRGQQSSMQIPKNPQEGKDKKKKEQMRNKGDIREYMGGQSKSIIDYPNSKTEILGEKHDNIPFSTTTPETTTPNIDIKPENKNSKKIFHSLTFFINGSTFPLISDHKLRHIVAENGGALSLNLARRSVTHVINAAPSAALSSAGASSSGARYTGGGGLSAAKMQKEIKTTAGKGKGVKFVGVDWIIESVKAGKRLSEARFVVSLEKSSNNNNKNALIGASSGQRSVYGMFKGVG
ncbi:uncharacterized protein TRUGW13939_06169 [Talaromyces rugulosus]|uniref:BRCT domain-containing protein n=1 Tax=Talaromyces rugulosus TaxID=121627 RepID=A0A7H8QY63_TALRU|nr:uncharacterized protein TRUGW13939_06169 [Talaromyces rugulosus]QKX59039.1 hypothetical protein TRUGW13939_06169 [Talaromyces rugulosus]